MEQPNEQRTLDAYVAASDENRRVVKNGNRSGVIVQEAAPHDAGREIRDERQLAWQADRHAHRRFREVLSKSDPATQRQIDFLKDLGVIAPAGLTRQAASELIDIGLQKRREQ